MRSTLCGTNSCVEVAVTENGVAIRDSKLRRGPVLEFEKAVWEDFIAGVRNGEFDRSPEDGADVA